MDKRHVCPHCEGTGEEPGSPIELELGSAYCSLCDGYGEVDTATLEDYNSCI